MPGKRGHLKHSVLWALRIPPIPMLLTESRQILCGNCRLFSTAKESRTFHPVLCLPGSLPGTGSGTARQRAGRKIRSNLGKTYMQGLRFVLYYAGMDLTGQTAVIPVFQGPGPCQRPAFLSAWIMPGFCVSAAVGPDRVSGVQHSLVHTGASKNCSFGFRTQSHAQKAVFRDCHTKARLAGQSITKANFLP